MTFERFLAVRLALGSTLALVALAAGCGPRNVDAILNNAHLCTTPDPDCGTNQAGAPLMCSAMVEGLGGKDICAEQCLEGPDIVTAAYACLQDGSKVARCLPSQGAAACSDPLLSCFRTDLEADEGLCLPVTTCNADSDCKRTDRTLCATTAVSHLLYPNAPGLKLDSLSCMGVNCYANQSTCPTGELCLQKVVGPTPDYPDVCLPTCESDGQLCPPNYSCLARLGPPYPSLCAPGLLGKPCGTDLDCMIGQCTDVGYGYKVCSRGCTTDADCIPFDSGKTYFFCANNRCISPESLLWPSCAVDADCNDPGLICARPHPDDQYGACRIPCAADGSCPARAGIIHGCHPWSGMEVCQPGVFGRYECTQDADCAPGLSCLPVNSDVAMSVELCSITCQTDADCAANRQTTNGYCGKGVCHQPETSGTTCDRDRICESGRCDETTKVCLGFP